jgi:Ni/Co efflux regulator RcnB
MKREFLAVIGVSIMTATMAAAQTAPANNSTSPPAISSGKADSNTTAAPVAGKNSFTEAQARSQIEKKGYTGVTGLMKDDQSIWRGKAMRDGKSMSVSVDYQGNVVGQ